MYSEVMLKMYLKFVLRLLIHLYLIVFVLSDATNSASKNDDIYRLSDDTTPLYYELKMAPNLGNYTFSGTVDIAIQVNVPTKVINLHSKQLTINECKVTKGYYKLLIDYHLKPENDFLVIEFPQKLPLNHKFVISIHFQGKLNAGWTGFMNNSYQVDGIEKRFAHTHFEPIHAREAFPCFDEPRFRAQFIIHLARDTYQNSISNMPIRTTTKDPIIEDRFWDEFESTPAMPTYLVSFAVSELAQLSDHEKFVSVWAREYVIEQVNYALQQGIGCLKQMEILTGIPYMLPKLDIVAIPNGRDNAMENWGMTTYREGQLFSNEDSSFNAKKLQTTLLCHEISHQWFGDLITLAWWDYPWIKEGFANYYQYFAAAKLEPDWRLDELFVTENMQTALWMDVNSDRSMTMSVKQNSQIQRVFDAVTYRKGASIIRMLEHIISMESFQKFVHNFLIQGRDKYNGVVNQENLFDVLENQVQIDHISLPRNISISQIMRTWTENTGYPLITVQRNRRTNTVKFRQTTYKTSRAPKPQPDQQWIVPIAYTTSLDPQFSDTTPSLWSFDQTPIQIPDNIFDTDWVLCNLQHSGFYRVNYDTHNWKLLISQLMEDHTQIHPLNRVQLIDDSFMLAYDGEISYWIPLQLALYLTKETDPIPWSSVLHHLVFLHETLAKKIINSFFGYYVQLIIENQYQNIGFKVDPNELELIRQIRPQLLQLACSVELSDCIKHSMDEYHNNENDLNKIHSDLKLAVFQTALRHAPDADYVESKLLSLYDEARNNLDKKTILLAMGSRGNRRSLDKILSKTGKHELIRFLEKLSHFETISSTNIITALLEKLHNEVSHLSELAEEDVSLLELLSTRISSGIQNEVHLNLMNGLKSKLERFGFKYANVMESIENVCISGEKIIEQINKGLNKFKTILIDVIVTFTDNVFFSPN